MTAPPGPDPQPLAKVVLSPWIALCAWIFPMEGAASEGSSPGREGQARRGSPHLNSPKPALPLSSQQSKRCSTEPCLLACLRCSKINTPKLVSLQSSPRVGGWGQGWAAPPTFPLAGLQVPVPENHGHAHRASQHQCPAHPEAAAHPGHTPLRQPPHAGAVQHHGWLSRCLRRASRGGSQSLSPRSCHSPGLDRQMDTAES